MASTSNLFPQQIEIARARVVRLNVGLLIVPKDYNIFKNDLLIEVCSS